MEKLQRQNRRIGLLKRVQAVKKQEALLEYTDTLSAKSDSQKSFDSSEQCLQNMLQLHAKSRSTSQIVDPMQQEYYMAHLDVLGNDHMEKQEELSKKTEEHKQSAQELANSTMKLKLFEKFEGELRQEIHAELLKKEMLDISKESAVKGETL